MIRNRAIPIYSQNGEESASLFTDLSRIFFSTLLIAAAMYFLYNMIRGGIDYMGSGGDKNQISDARQRIVNAVIGVIVVFGLMIFVNFLEGVFGFSIFSFSLSDLRVTAAP